MSKKLNSYEIPIVYNYKVDIHKKITVQAETKEEAIKIIKEKFEKDSIDPKELQYVDEFWELEDLKILDK